MKYSIFIILAVIFYLILSLSLSHYEAIAIFISINRLYILVKNFSHKFLIADIISYLATLTWLIAPIIIYHVPADSSHFVFLWQLNMPIPLEQYFSYALPATLALILGLNFNKNYDFNYNNVQLRIKSQLQGKGVVSIILLIFGVISSILANYTDSSIASFFQISSFSIYVAPFFAIYSKFRYKKIIIVIAIFFVLLQISDSAMFGSVILIFTLWASIFSFNFNFRFRSKITLLAAFIFFVIIVQSLKSDFRVKAWDEKDGSIFYLGELFLDRLSNPKSLISSDQYYSVIHRFNNGLYVAQAMNYVPTNQEFVYGETILEGLAAASIPRFLWPDKPSTGGEYMTCKFLGDCEHKGHSYNIGILGEAYVNFGLVGGILFMLLYGLAFSKALHLFLKSVKEKPVLLIWSPVLWANAVVLETDFLSVASALIKTLMFYYLFSRFIKIFYRLEV